MKKRIFLIIASILCAVVSFSQIVYTIVDSLKNTTTTPNNGNNVNVNLGNTEYGDPVDVSLGYLLGDIVDDEILSASREHRPAERKNFKYPNVWTSILTQILWMFALKTDAAKKLAKRQNLFIRYRDALISKALPMFCDNQQCYQLTEQILTIFPDSYFKEEII